jgi:bifunctional non-homologous end joining protein LigD
MAFQQHTLDMKGLKGTAPATWPGHDPAILFTTAEDLAAGAQLDMVEVHTWNSTEAAPHRPDRLVFDLDPDVGLDFGKVKDVAVKLQALLADLGLKTFPLLSGGKGLHVVAPLDQSADWPTVSDFAERFSRAIAEAEPEMFTANIRKVQRKGRIFLDWLRNQRGATAVMPYSARAREGAPVAAPIAWDELDKYQGGNHFTIRDADELLERASSKALAGWGKADQALPDA